MRIQRNIKIRFLIVAAALALACFLAGTFCLRRDSFAASGEIGASAQAAGDKFFGDDYLSLYALPSTALQVSNNGGGDLAKAFDGNFATQWTSEKQNSRTDTGAAADFYNEVTIAFPSTQTVDRVLYQASDARVAHGYPTILEIFASVGGEFRSLGTCESTPTAQRVVFRFGPTACEGVKLVWREANKSHNWVATAKEIAILTPDDTGLDRLASLFADYTETTIAAGITADVLSAARAAYSSRLNYADVLSPLLDRAERALSGELRPDPLREFGTGKPGSNRLARYGNIRSYCANVLKMSSFGVDYQPTGVAAVAGAKLTVYVEAKESDPLPTLVFTQSFNDWQSWISRVPLARGKNLVTVPDFVTGRSSYTVAPEGGLTAGGPIYLENPYTESEQSSSVKVYLEGGDLYPLYREGGDRAAFVEAVKSYRDKLEAHPGEYADVVELVSDHVLVTSVTSSALSLFADGGNDPEASCAGWDSFMRSLLSFGGVSFDAADAHYEPIHEHLRHNLRVVQPWAGALAYAAGGFCGFCMGAYRDDFALLNHHQFGWAMAHELGHSFDNNMGDSGRLIGEVTNNMWSIFNRNALEKNPEKRYDDTVFLNELAPDDLSSPRPFENHYGTGYVFWWLIESRYPGFWGRMENLYRYRDVAADLTAAGVTAEEGKLFTKEERHAYLCSLAAETDLSAYFDRWGFYFSDPANAFDADGVSEAYRKLISRAKTAGELPRAPLKFWYSDYWNYNYVAGGGQGIYSEEDGTAVRDVFAGANGYTVVLPETDDAAHLGYEISESGRVIGFTTASAFTDETLYPAGYLPVYTVRAYDRLLGCTAESAPASPAPAKEAVCRIGDDRYSSLSEAIAAAKDGDTVTVFADARAARVAVERNLTVEGEAGASVRRGDTGDLFTVKAGVTLTLRGLVFDGGAFTQTGSFVNVEQGGTLVCEDATFRNCYTAGTGGALSSAGKLVLSSVRFQNGRADKGGAIFVSSARGNAELALCTFEGNSAAEEGGAVCQCGTMRFESCTFSGNAARSGGAVANVSGGVMSMTNVVLSHNRAEEQGGALYADGNTVLAASELNGNSAKEGGGMACRGANGARSVTVQAGESAVKFKSNRAERGGAIYVEAVGAFTAEALALVANEAEEGSAFYVRSGKAAMPAQPDVTEDFTFTGWSVNGQAVGRTLPQTDFADGTAVDAAGNARFYVRYRYDGAPLPDLVSAGSEIVLPESVPAGERQRFAGWSVNGTLLDGGARVTVEEDLSIEPSFRDLCKVTYYVDGKASGSELVPEGDALHLPEAPARAGSRFLGWQVKDALRAAGDVITVEEDLSVEAMFEAEEKEEEPRTALIIGIAVGVAGLSAMLAVYLVVNRRSKKK